MQRVLVFFFHKGIWVHYSFSGSNPAMVKLKVFLKCGLNLSGPGPDTLAKRSVSNATALGIMSLGRVSFEENDCCCLTKL